MLKVLAFLFLIYTCLLTLLYFFQRDLLFHPSSAYEGPSKLYPGLGLEEQTVVTEDGIPLKMWYAPAKGKKLTLLYFHGNADNLRTAAGVLLPYIQAGYGVLVAEYRGYSGLPGRPTETGLYRDGRAALGWLAKHDLRPEQEVLFGYSLGTGVAVQLATEVPVKALILVAPYTSMVDLARQRFPFFPVEWLTRDRFENFHKIGSFHGALLIANGGHDVVVPPAQGQQIFNLAHEPKEYVFIPEGTHINIFESEFLAKSLTWLERLDASVSQNSRQRH